MAQLQKLSEFCDFKDTLADMLRDCLVCGCRDRRLQCKLLAEKDLTFDQALAIAKALETAKKETKDLQESSSTVPVHTVRQERRHPQRRAPNQPVAKPQGPECYRCGGKHRATESKFYETECLVCKKTYTLQSKVEFELNRLQTAGVIKPVKFSVGCPDCPCSQTRRLNQDMWRL